MPNSIESTARTELQWDQAAIQRNAQNLENAYAVTMPLSPTALLPATWLFQGYPGINAYCFKFVFSTDTAIRWTLATAFGVSGYTAFPPVELGNTSGGAFYNPQGLVIAPPALVGLIDSGYASAGSYTDLCAGKWFAPKGSSGVSLYTSAVAANCSLTIWWVEATD